MKVDESILGEGAWERGTPGQFQQSGGHQLERGRLGHGGHTQARGSGSVRAGLDLPEVSTGRQGGTLCHTSPHRSAGPRARWAHWFLGFGSHGLKSRHGPAGLPHEAQGKSASKLFHVVRGTPFPVLVGLGPISLRLSAGSPFWSLLSIPASWSQERHDKPFFLESL